MPNRSASRTTITVAFATSTPTSMTVVATRTSIRPAAKRRITSSFTSGASRPCSTSTVSPGSGPRPASARSSSTAQRRARAVPPPFGVVGVVGVDARTHDVDLPTGLHLLARPLPDPVEPRPACPAVGTTVVAIGCRPAGSSVSVEVSRSPYTVMATVRGIGVAVITSTCGGVAALLRNASRCSTPNRCCSSTTTSPRSKNWTVFSQQRVGPDDDAGIADADVEQRLAPRGGALIDPVTSATRVASSAAPSSPCRPSGPSSASIDRACCCASTSVGASNAACPPESTTASIARSATTVLPDPTSPCSRRCIGTGRARSAISSVAHLTAGRP